MLRHYRLALGSLILALALAAWLGGAHGLWVCTVLVVLEMSFSFDNAVVNAKTLQTMDPVWRARFLLWGILVAVFGMRLVFPVAVVAIGAQIDPWSVLMLALRQPERYAELLTAAQVPIYAFGGAFLWMVFLNFFVDQNKRLHWLRPLEPLLQRTALLGPFKYAATLLVILAFAYGTSEGSRLVFVLAALWGILTHLLVDLFTALLSQRHAAAEEGKTRDATHRVECCTECHDTDGNTVEETHGTDRPTGASRSVAPVAMTGLSGFLYLEVLDASFSLDGVIGAFALSFDPFIIMLGLGVGALFVRSFTLVMVECGTLKAYRYLEHGAFWAIGALALVMLIAPSIRLPEWITGGIGLVLIGAAFVSSRRGRSATR